MIIDLPIVSREEFGPPPAMTEIQRNFILDTLVSTYIPLVSLALEFDALAANGLCKINPGQMAAELRAAPMQNLAEIARALGFTQEEFGGRLTEFVERANALIAASQGDA